MSGGAKEENPVDGLGSWRSRCLVLVAALAATTACVGAARADVSVIGTHNAKFNLDGTLLGAYKDHTPLALKNVPPGHHKLFAKSLVTG